MISAFLLKNSLFYSLNLLKDRKKVKRSGLNLAAYFYEKKERLMIIRINLGSKHKT